MQEKRKLIGEILMANGCITHVELNGALADQKRSKRLLGQILIGKGWVTESDLVGALSEQFRIPFVSLKERSIDWAFARRFSPRLIVDHQCFPIARDERSVTVAISNPLDVWGMKKAEEEVRRFGELRVKLVLAISAEIGELIKGYQRYAIDGMTAGAP